MAIKDFNNKNTFRTKMQAIKAAAKLTKKWADLTGGAKMCVRRIPQHIKPDLPDKNYVIGFCK